MDQRGDITRLLSAANDGDPECMRTVLTLLHDRLRVIAHRQLAREAGGHTLETDGLVNEAFLRMLGVERVQWRDREHLLATAARMMRRVLIDYADKRRAQKRGGGDSVVTLNESLVAVEQYADELHALDEALARLEAENPRYSRIVECRFFAGLSIEETAEMLSLSPATVKRGWMTARAWLNRELQT
jgi:RNA polymerase sigma factor (TIGR02999 family)